MYRRRWSIFDPTIMAFLRLAANKRRRSIIDKCSIIYSTSQSSNQWRHSTSQLTNDHHWYKCSIVSTRDRRHAARRRRNAPRSRRGVRPRTSSIVRRGCTRLFFVSMCRNDVSVFCACSSNASKWSFSMLSIISVVCVCIVRLCESVWCWYFCLAIVYYWRMIVCFRSIFVRFVIGSRYDWLCFFIQLSLNRIRSFSIIRHASDFDRSIYRYVSINIDRHSTRVYASMSIVIANNQPTSRRCKQCAPLLAGAERETLLVQTAKLSSHLVCRDVVECCVVTIEPLLTLFLFVLHRLNLSSPPNLGCASGDVGVQRPASARTAAATALSTWRFGF